MGRITTGALGQVVELAARRGHVFVATAGADGMPHVAAAGKLVLNEHKVEVTAWFCPATAINLERNPAVALVAWDPVADTGYQVLGRMERIETMSVLDGYFPEEEKMPLPQLERKLVIRPEKILDFTAAPHSDLEPG